MGEKRYANHHPIERMPYTTPELIVHGSVEKITLKLSAGPSDALFFDGEDPIPNTS